MGWSDDGSMAATGEVPAWLQVSTGRAKRDPYPRAEQDDWGAGIEDVGRGQPRHLLLPRAVSPQHLPGAAPASPRVHWLCPTLPLASILSPHSRWPSQAAGATARGRGEGGHCSPSPIWWYSHVNKPKRTQGTAYISGVKKTVCEKVERGRETRRANRETHKGLEKPTHKDT